MTNKDKPAGGVMPEPFDLEIAVEYAKHYGPRCRDCADENGVCPYSGLPCGEDKGIRHVVGAIHYGLTHGYIKPCAAQPQPPVIEGPVAWQVYNQLVKSWTTTYHDADKVMALKADGWEIRPLYSQGQTAQPQGDLVLCRRVIKVPEHEGATGYEYFVPVKEAQPVDLDGFDKLVEMLDREPQHNPRLSALLREDSVFDKQPTEDAGANQ